MSTNFPTTIDDFTNPSATDKVSAEVGGRKHANFHADNNDAIEALEAKVGVDSSAVTTSHDYKLSEVTTTDKAVGKAAIQTLTNKTLTSPKVGTAITDTNGNEVIKTPATGSAVNEITVTNSATGNDPQISATGDDSDISVKITPKGTGSIKLGTANLKFPNADGTANQVLKTDGSAQLSWVTQSASPSALTLIPQSNRMIFPNAANYVLTTFETNTTMLVGQISIPYSIVVNKVTLFGQTSGTGAAAVAVFSEDGQTRHINEDITIVNNANGTVTLSSPVTLSPGIYYIATLPKTGIGTATILNWNTNVGDGTTFLNGVTGEPVIEGTLAVTADTIPATITPSAITGSVFKTAIVRLDN